MTRRQTRLSIDSHPFLINGRLTDPARQWRETSMEELMMEMTGGL
jgi:hypothetical protein